MKLVRMDLSGDPVVAHGDTDSPSDFTYLAAVFEEQTEGGMFAVVRRPDSTLVVEGEWSWTTFRTFPKVPT